MNPTLLETFLAVADSASFREAAERLAISQPAVSFQLRQLERGAPSPLFYLSGRRKRLTRYGEELAAAARRHLGGLRRGLEDLDRRYADPASLTLRVAARPELLEHVGPRLRFAGKLELVPASGPEAVRKLLAHEIDVAVSHLLPDSTELVARKLFTSAAYFVASRELGARPDPASPAFLRSAPAVAYQRDGHLLRDWAKHRGVDPSELRVRYVTEDWRLVRSLVESGAGYAIVPEYVAGFSPRVHRRELPAKVLKPFVFHALYHRGLAKIAAYREVLEFRGLRA